MAHLLPMQGVARNGAKTIGDRVSPYVYESQGVAIPNRDVENCGSLFPVVQIGPSSVWNCVKSRSHFPGFCWFFRLVGYFEMDMVGKFRVA
jgi:hypothetical protein